MGMQEKGKEPKMQQQSIVQASLAIEGTKLEQIPLTSEILTEISHTYFPAES
jgi:hypothetical protein